MPPLNPHIDPHAEADLRAEAYLDGDLSPEEAARFDADLARRPDLRAALDLARRVQDELRLMPQPLCPPELTAAVLREARRQEAASVAGRVRAGLHALARPAAWTSPAWRPALALSLLLVVALALVGRSGSSGPPPVAPEVVTAEPPTDAEVTRAVHDVKWALALVSEAGEVAGRSVRDDVLGGDILQPVQHALGVVLPKASPSDDDE